MVPASKSMDRLERVIEELAIVVDPAQSRSSDEVAAQDLPPRALTSLLFGEESVAADIEAVPLVLVRPADAADESGVGLQHHAGLAVSCHSWRR